MRAIAEGAEGAGFRTGVQTAWFVCGYDWDREGVVLPLSWRVSPRMHGHGTNTWPRRVAVLWHGCRLCGLSVSAS